MVAMSCDRSCLCNITVLLAGGNQTEIVNGQDCRGDKSIKK